MKILFLAANPKGTDQLQLDEEAKKIEEGLERSKLRDQFTLVTRWAVDSETLRRAMLKEQPDIVHFSGHGAGQAGLVLVGHDGSPKPATAEALSGLFEIFHGVKCVLLNACYAEVQAKAIVKHIDYVVGMKKAMRDDAAIAFATGFYDGLGYGLEIEDAFKLGCNAIQFEMASFSPTTRKLIPTGNEKTQEISEAMSENLIPTLLRKTGSGRVILDPLVQSNSLVEKLRETDEINKPEAIQQYRERVKEFLADRKLTPVEEFQLTTLAKVLGLSDLRAGQILKEEQKHIEDAKENYRQIFTQTIQKGYYPFSDQVDHELHDLQKELGLTDSEVREVTLPALLKYENSSETVASNKKPLSIHQKKSNSNIVVIGLMMATFSVIGILLAVNYTFLTSEDSYGTGPIDPPITDVGPGQNIETDNPVDPPPQPITIDPKTDLSELFANSAGVQAVINDPDGYTNVRSGQGTQYDVIAKVLDEEVFYTIPQDGNWWPVRTGSNQFGYMAKNKIQEVVIPPELPDDYFMYDYAWLSETPVSESDLEGKTAWDLDIMRNSIYARHGRRFDNAELQAYFDQQPGYQPIYSPSEFDTLSAELLSSIEAENGKFILRYQDDYGLRYVP